MQIKDAIAAAIAHQDLAFDDMLAVVRQIMAGEATPAQIAGLLVALRMKGETVDEITAAASVMRELSLKVESACSPLIDTCGTGGDGVLLYAGALVVTDERFHFGGQPLALGAEGFELRVERCAVGAHRDDHGLGVGGRGGERRLVEATKDRKERARNRTARPLHRRPLPGSEAQIDRVKHPHRPRRRWIGLRDLVDFKHAFLREHGASSATP
jgi:hypothetical protein